jgi:transaldolase / glucose-6-phosphate isomerase
MTGPRARPRPARARDVTGPAVRFRFGPLSRAVGGRERSWTTERVAARFWRPDPALWPNAPASDVTSRMGWLDLPDRMRAELPRLERFAREVRSDGTRHVVLLGMGGSSLAPDVFRRILGSAPGYPELIVLDSTHPDAVAAVAERIDPARSLFVVSSKSGTTTEPLDFHRFFWERVIAHGGTPADHFVAVTDPGSPLVTLATERKFRAVFPALPTVGGRYSALTTFGLVPAALLGADVGAVLERARAMATACSTAAVAENPGLALGAALGELATRGRDKLTFYAGAPFAAFPDWAEQLVAESTGKIGRGIVPVAHEPILEAGRYGADRVFVEFQVDGAPDAGLAAHVDALVKAGHPAVRIRVGDGRDLGGEFFRWEVAIASAGMVLGINPFDQPDVELAKELARQAMRSGGAGDAGAATPTVPADRPRELAREVGAWVRGARPGEYAAIQAYLAPTDATSAALARLQRSVFERTGVATTVGYGPRFLHSTGQLHKGGPPTGRFLQLVDRPRQDLEVPGAGYTFGALIRAQAIGDYRALRQKGRTVLRVDLGSNVGASLARVDGAVRG